MEDVPGAFLPLALAGERLCREGDFRAAVAVFRDALTVGTEDIALLSAVYIQLGNAYFHLEQYEEALDFHTRDLHIARSTGDLRGEAKASGNIATTLKSLSRFEEALMCAIRQLELCRTFGDDPAGISRALYNTASIVHAKAKTYAARHSDAVDVPEGVKRDLNLAADYYLQNYRMVLDLGDTVGQGRVCGNLGNVYYLLGDFAQALAFHQTRLTLARESNDVSAQRRAQTNLGNCHIFLGQHQLAAESYQKALELVGVVKDSAAEAQACYSLANCYTLMRDHPRALELYQRHLAAVTELGDRTAQGTSNASLGCTLAALERYSEALIYAKDYSLICQELGDAVGCSAAEAYITEYTHLLAGTTTNHPVAPPSGEPPLITAHAASAAVNNPSNTTQDGSSSTPEAITARVNAVVVHPLLPGRFGAASSSPASRSQEGRAGPVPLDASVVVGRRLTPDILTPAEHKRLLPLFIESPVRQPRSVTNRQPRQTTATPSSSLLLAASATTAAEDSPGAEPELAHQQLDHSSSSLLYARSDDSSRDHHQQPEEDFFDLLQRVQSTRLNDQRCEVAVPSPEATTLKNGDIKTGPHHTTAVCNISSREELMDFIAGIQSKRIDAQRAHLPPSSGSEPLGSLPIPDAHTAASLLLSSASGSSVPLLSVPPEGCSDKSSAVPRTESDKNNPLYPGGNLSSRDQQFLAALMSAPPHGPGGNGAPRNADSQEHLSDSFYDMLMKVQSTRMDDQRCTVNLSSNRPPVPLPAGSDNFSTTTAQGRRTDNQRGSSDVTNSKSSKK
ncbi:G-protein-signaling modulator 1 [Hypsibius exemplaris]|uniref:G-protein-signaling modulator 1 n=1 Tax=Hypsibius exemplaris TaxID=2072580 RepID=A0A1W0XED0_HYPEX|nr:G-protein-signaling modulator 1 [Hypsibius exemplaris]